VWLIIAVRLLIPFSPSIGSVAPITIPSIDSNVQIIVPAPVSTSTPSQPTHLPTQPTALVNPGIVAPHAVSVSELFPIIWLMGLIIFFSYYVVGYSLFRKSVLRFSEGVEDDHTLDLWSHIKQEMGIKDHIELVRSRKVKSPMILGFFKPMFLLPCASYNDYDRQLIMKHELIHYLHHDVWNKLVLLLANAVHWFNPLIYVVRWRFYADVELACDSELVYGSDITFRKQYGETILAAIHKGNNGGTEFSTYFMGE
jgi:beta-lactamase regulating signal transducer with metallopeptidase domain